jgi:IclR family transcriptional regulator, KDG regulon repressor
MATSKATAGPADTKGTVVRVVDLLRSFAEGPAQWSLSEIAERVALPRSTTHRLLQLLRSQGFVDADDGDGRYAAGAELYRVAALLAARMPLVQLATPILREIVDACDETALLGLYQRDRHMMIFAAKVESTKPVRYVIDLNVPQTPLWGATGRAIAAHLDEAELERAIAANPLAPDGRPQRLDRRALRAELEAIRRDGFAFSSGQRIPTAVGIAAPFFFADGTVAGDVAVTIPEFRFDARKRGSVVGLVRDAAGRISEALGYRAPATSSSPPNSARTSRSSPSPRPR